MNDFIRDLYHYCSEQPDPPRTRKQQKISEKILRLEDELKQQVGLDLLTRYQCAVDEFYDFQFNEAFLHGIRFGAQFMLSVFPQSSNTSSTP